MNKIKKSIGLIGLIMVLVACSQEEDSNIPYTASTKLKLKSIGQTIDTSKTLDSLAIAIKHANLYNTLISNNSITFFASNNVAFQNYIAKDSSIEKITDISKDKLRNILLYHLVNGVINPSELIDEDYLISINSKGANNEATVVEVDISPELKLNNIASFNDVSTCLNGTLIQIDQLLSPLNSASLLEVDNQFQDFNAAIDFFGDTIKSLLKTDTNYTLFCPTNQAFQSYLNTNAWTDLSMVPRNDLKSLILNHMIPKRNIRNGQFLTNEYLETENNTYYKVYVSNTNNLITNSLFPDTIQIIAMDVQGTNGVIHQVNQVLF